MSPSSEPLQDDRQLVRYLLGQLSEDETERMDEASVVDDAVAFRLRSAENDLVDAYVAGTLDGETRKQFERFYLGTARRREKVRFADRFLRAVDRVPEPVPVRRRLTWLVAAAAGLVLALGVLLFDNGRLRERATRAQGDVAALSTRVQTLSRQLDESHAAQTESARALEAARERDPAPGAAQPAPAAPALDAIALVLSPQTRAVGPVPAVVVAPGAERVAFELRLDTNDFPRYQAVLNDPRTGRAVWRSGTMAAQTRRGTPVIPLTIPAAALQTQHYSLQLAGVRPGGAAETVNSYAFQVDRR